MKTRPFVFASGLVVLIALLCQWALRSTEEVDLSLLQYTVFPLFLGFLFWLQRIGIFLPRAALFLVALSVACASIFAFSLFEAGSPHFYVARLSGDRFETATRIFRSQLSEEMQEHGGGQVARFYRSFEDGTEAAAVFEERKNVFGVVYGDTNKLKTLFVQDDTAQPHPVPIHFRRSVQELFLVEHVPSLWVSFQPARETVVFLGYLFSALEQRKFSDPSERAVYEANLIASEELKSFWTSFSHLAYPLWRLGNLYVKDFIDSGFEDDASLKCALSVYTEAASFLQPTDNYPLQAAIFNNKAVALLLQSRSTEMVREAFALLHQATRFQRADPVYQDESGVINENLGRVVSEWLDRKYREQPLEEQGD